MFISDLSQVKNRNKDLLRSKYEKQVQYKVLNL